MQHGDIWAVVVSARFEALVKDGVVSAVERDLASIRERDESLADGGLAAIARSLAADADDRSISSTQRTSARRALADVLVQLRGLVPESAGTDTIDDLAKRREVRRQSAGGR